ncbi:MAG: sulfatase [Verrucomicrobiota bacterium JB024]|nr:sulfatase [Verrucomicrobiota bacterium JB024]
MSAAKPPNIVYFHTHDSGRFFQPYGYAVPTPWMQRIAEEGVLFRKAFCASPTCSPSRAALLTGQSPHSVGMLGLAHRGHNLEDYSQTLVHLLNQAGYETALCGIQHVIEHNRRGELGYRRDLATANYSAAAQSANQACAFIENHADTPFFLDVGVSETHRCRLHEPGGPAPYHEDGPLGDPRYVRPPETIPDTPANRRDWADFCAAAQRADHELGRIYQALESHGELEHTLFIITTDHGPALPRMKCCLSDAGLQVALILRGPGGFSGGQVIDAMVSHLDLIPTLCDWLGLATPGVCQGHSMIPLLNGTEGELHDELFGEVTYHGPNIYNPQRSIRTPRYKLVRRYAEGTQRVVDTCDQSVPKMMFLEAGWEQLPLEPVELYDLMLDPTEQRNLASLPLYEGIRAGLEQRLEQWMQETSDPLLDISFPPSSLEQTTGHP